MDKTLCQLVWGRAGRRCETCRNPEPPFQIEHIIARQHGGLTIAENLALACIRCNLHNGPNLSGVDRIGGVIVTLYQPRQQKWAEHFRIEDGIIIGLTPTGRATAESLRFNDVVRVDVRVRLIGEGRYD
jgi:hypothetical protein